MSNDFYIYVEFTFADGVSQKEIEKIIRDNADVFRREIRWIEHFQHGYFEGVERDCKIDDDAIINFADDNKNLLSQFKYQIYDLSAPNIEILLERAGGNIYITRRQR